jgi:hypothetical protein
MQKTLAGKRTRYDLWNSFKQDLESNLGCHVENGLWLKIKPRKALPWHGSDMEVALARILKY